MRLYIYLLNVNFRFQIIRKSIFTIPKEYFPGLNWKDQGLPEIKKS